MDLNNINAGIKLIKKVLEQNRPAKTEKKPKPIPNNEDPKTPQ